VWARGLSYVCILSLLLSLEFGGLFSHIILHPLIATSRFVLSQTVLVLTKFIGENIDI